MLEVYGLCLIPNIDLKTFVGKKLSDVEILYGRPHVDVGSGLSIPGYLTVDAYLVYFYVNDEGVIVRARKKDLLTNTVCEDWTGVKES